MSPSLKPAMPASDHPFRVESVVGKAGERLPAFAVQWLRKMFSIRKSRHFEELEDLQCVVGADGKLSGDSSIRIELRGVASESLAHLRPAIIVGRHEKQISVLTIGNGNPTGGFPAVFDGAREFQRSVMSGLSFTCQADSYHQCDILQHEVLLLVDQLGIFLTSMESPCVSQFRVTGMSNPSQVKKDSSDVYSGTVDTAIGYEYKLIIREVEPIIKAMYFTPEQA